MSHTAAHAVSGQQVPAPLLPWQPTQRRWGASQDVSVRAMDNSDLPDPQLTNSKPSSSHLLMQLLFRVISLLFLGGHEKHVSAQPAAEEGIRKHLN